MDNYVFDSIVEMYLNLLGKSSAKRIDEFAISPNIEEQICHLRYMLDEIEIMDPKDDKTNRWLGFVQGVMWANGMFNLKSLKDHNKPQNFWKVVEEGSVLSS